MSAREPTSLRSGAPAATLLHRLLRLAIARGGLELFAFVAELRAVDPIRVLETVAQRVWNLPGDRTRPTCSGRRFITIVHS